MSAVKLVIPDSRMFFVVSFEYRTEVLTIFRTFPLVPGFRSGSNSYERYSLENGAQNNRGRYLAENLASSKQRPDENG